MKFSSFAALSASLISSASAVTIAQINGNRYLSPYQGQRVTDVRGLVTAKGPNGFWIRSTTPDSDDRTSESIYVFGRAALPNATVGNVVSLNGRITEYRSSPAYVYLTEIDQPSNITTISTGNSVKPRVLGGLIGTVLGTSPPTQQYISLDNGDIFAVPNNVSQISVVNPVLQPRLYGMDFWESINGELVTVRSPRAVSRPNNFGDVWVVGNWITTGNNDRGSLTVRDRDANPETVIIGSPLDGTDNADVKLGDSLADITGVVTYTFGFYYILPQTGLRVTSSKSPTRPPPTKLVSIGKCSGITMGQYNVENLSPKSGALIGEIAAQIVNDLRSPDLLFIQEIQDNNGATNDAVVDANLTLSALTSAINAASSTVSYTAVDIDPVDDQDGGQPGGNIRVAYLYNPKVLRLHNPRPGSSTDATEVLPGPELSFNPGRIDPTNEAWRASRKPLVAAWETLDGKNKFFTVNVHWTSKGGGSSLQGDARPPVNGGVAQRNAQAQITGDFIAQILEEDSNAAIVSAGDYNEFTFVQPLETFASASGLVDLDVAAGILPVERYTYTFDMNTQQLDHMYVSPKVARLLRFPQFEHVHVSSWVLADEVVSDHDPSVAKLNICT
ncbi:hypothetical protein LTR56_009629 [Elasticomyces elasticus]|nr:hypothetical protein LTR56_009629 [Elasticomyces elasticus]KAK3660129.1 hypothetical protein LTR22_008136 [Elasticomyces elasticus]KAK4923434.1 hypothetical protein LTR49_009308 [Elasticomyces elasticus]